MKTEVLFSRHHIAPCGINCGTCRAYLRDKNKCSGCMAASGTIMGYCERCSIRNCSEIKNSESKFCYECKDFPCKRLKQIDKRYQTKYRTGLIQNLQDIKIKGIDAYLLLERSKWTCTHCGAVLSVHDKKCIKCGMEYL
jgi:hypothetical protein